MLRPVVVVVVVVVVRMLVLVWGGYRCVGHGVVGVGWGSMGMQWSRVTGCGVGYR